MVEQSTIFLNENKVEIEKQLSKVNISNWDWFLRRKKQKEDLQRDLLETGSLVDMITEEHKQKAEDINFHLTEFYHNISRKQEFVIENGELYIVDNEVSVLF